MELTEKQEDLIEIEEGSLDYLKDSMENKQKKKPSIFKKWSFAATSFLLLSSLINYFVFTSNLKLKKENRELYSKNTSYEQTIQDMEENINNLKRLNEEGIIVLNEKVDELIGKMPVRGLFSLLERLVGGIGIFNNNPMSTHQLKEIVQFSQDYIPPQYLEDTIKEVGSYSTNPNEIWEDWKLRVHGIGNYIPKNPEITLPIIKNEKNGENGKNTTVNQDFGNNSYVVILGEGFHEGIDISNKKARNLHSGFDGKILEDQIYPGKGRTISILANYRGEKGERYKMSASHLASGTKELKKGKQIKKGEYFGNTGTTGFVSGQHAHVEFYISYNKGKKWELYYPYENGTYLEGENIVWFKLDDNAENMPDSIINALGEYLEKAKKSR